MAIIGLHTAIYAAPNMAKARKFFTDWGLKRVSTSKSATVFETEVGSRVILKPPTARNLPPAPVKGMNFREMIWGVSSKSHLNRIARELAKDREVTTDKDGTIHCFDPNEIAVGFRLWKQPRKPKTPATPINSHGSYERVDKLSRIYDRARPIAMGHIGFIVPDLKSAEDFYPKRLGFPVSDRYAGGAALFVGGLANAVPVGAFSQRSEGAG